MIELLDDMSGPAGDPAVLIVRTEEGKGLAPEGQDRGQCAPSHIVHHAHVALTHAQQP